MKTEELRIDGMSCGHCVAVLRKELERIDGLKIVSLEIGKARVQYDTARVSWEDLERAVTTAGYRIASQ